MQVQSPETFPRERFPNYDGMLWSQQAFWTDVTESSQGAVCHHTRFASGYIFETLRVAIHGSSSGTFQKRYVQVRIPLYSQTAACNKVKFVFGNILKALQTTIYGSQKGIYVPVRSMYHFITNLAQRLSRAYQKLKIPNHPILTFQQLLRETNHNGLPSICPPHVRNNTR